VLVNGYSLAAVFEAAQCTGFAGIGDDSLKSQYRILLFKGLSI